MRLDKYLKVSRIIKRRTVANDACDAAHVTVNGRPAKASYDVKEGDVIAEALAAGDDVKITGFGGFEVKARAARTGRNPKTGETVEIPASKYVAFSAGSTLKEKVNG